jgi:uncharacterized protein (DUF4415 family)/uncharacterized DUF497 family protein
LLEVFDGRFTFTRQDARFDYGELLYNMLVEFRGRIINITFNPRDGKVHLISVRPASREGRKERCQAPGKRVRPPGAPIGRASTASRTRRSSMAASDADNPATKVEDWTQGFVGLPRLKTPVNAKFDADVVAWFKSFGRGYQTHMNAVLRKYMEAHRTTG